MYKKQIVKCFGVSTISIREIKKMKNSDPSNPQLCINHINRGSKTKFK